MGETAKCPECGAELYNDSRQCVPCLLRLGSVAPSDWAKLHGSTPPEVSCEPHDPNIAVTLPSSEQSGDLIGRYKLLQPIGDGGMGAVWMAEQTEPVRRRVALKIIKLGMDTKQVIGRFEAERQALALMDHPNIAKVFDAGASDTGRPYFVMELVNGVPIAQYCDQNKLNIRQRLDLFIQVCQAIQHAHQKGVIHRDIKPSNILVADHQGVPIPKVIDFGIAKATTGQPLTNRTLFTAFEQFIGTPAYMSPEQAKLSGLDVDTRSDIYSLGVLFYELLIGKTPFDSKRLLRAGLDEIQRIIREEDPPRPSAKFSTLDLHERKMLAQQRQCEPPKLLSLMRGDLDWIAMRALEKDRNQRYASASDLAMDIQRHIRNEPVTAVAPNLFYKFKKFARRRKATVVILLSAIILLPAVVIGSLWLALLFSQANDRTQVAFQTAFWSAEYFRISIYLESSINEVNSACTNFLRTKNTAEFARFERKSNEILIWLQDENERLVRLDAMQKAYSSRVQMSLESATTFVSGIQRRYTNYEAAAHHLIANPDSPNTEISLLRAEQRLSHEHRILLACSRQSKLRGDALIQMLSGQIPPK